MSSKTKTVLILLLICAIIAVVPLALIKNSEFGGSDDAAEKAISELDPDYEVWITPMIEPETESLLFCLQAALGAGILGYGFGVLKERSRQDKKKEPNHDYD